mgnify:CR=1 FL=1
MKNLALLILLTLCVHAVAEQKVLHVSTIPNHADIYVGEIQPSHTKNPAFVSPAFITMDDSETNEILISLFNPGFTDTTLRVKLSDKDTSYIIVSQQPIITDDLLEDQQAELSKRSRKNFGKALMKSSIIPFVVGLVAGSVAYYEIDKAKKDKRTLKNSSIRNDDYNEVADRFKDHRQNAKTAKHISYGAFLSGAALLSIGFILSF